MRAKQRLESDYTQVYVNKEVLMKQVTWEKRGGTSEAPKYRRKHFISASPLAQKTPACEPME